MQKFLELKKMKTQDFKTYSVQLRQSLEKHLYCLHTHTQSERTQTNKLMMHLKALQKQEQTKSHSSKQKKKIRLGQKLMKKEKKLQKELVN